METFTKKNSNENTNQVLKALPRFFIILGLSIISFKVHAQPIYTVSYTDPDCSFNNGQMIVNITSGLQPFAWELYEMGGTSNPPLLSGTLSASPPCSFTINNLSPNRYQLKVTDINGTPNWQSYNMMDKTKFPIVPFNSHRAFGVDVKTNHDGDVYATGFFSGLISFNNTFNANAFLNTYLVKFDPCGNVEWDLSIGLTGNCSVNSLTVDYSNSGEWVTICGKYSGTILFPGGTQLANSGNVSSAFIARFDGNGTFLWAATIEGPGEVTAKGITSDDNGDIIVMGDFNNTSATVHNANGNIAGVLSNLGNAADKDNYYVVYDQSGKAKVMDNIRISTIFDDEAGGVCCYTDPLTNYTEVFFTGLWGGDFLGQRFTLKQNPFGFTQTNIYLPPAVGGGWYSEYFGKSVAWYKDPNGIYSIYFAVKAKNFIGGSSPIIFYSFLPPAIPLLASLTNYQIYVAQLAVSSNAPTCMAIRQSTGELYMGGYTTQFGNYPIYQVNTVNGESDVFVTNGFIQSPPSFFSIANNWFPPVSSDASHNAVFDIGNVPQFFGLCADENTIGSSNVLGKAYITGSYKDQLLSNQQWAGINFPMAPAGGEACYIARLINGANLDGWIRSSVIDNSKIESNDLDLEIFPNPVSDYLSFRIPGLPDGLVNIIIYGIDGRQLTSTATLDLKQGYARFNFTDYRPGFYFIKVNIANTTIIKKVVKN